MRNNKIENEKIQLLVNDIIDQFKLQYDFDSENEKDISFVSN